MSNLFRLIVPALVGIAWFPLIPSRAAERPDPKMISITLPDEIHWRKSENADIATIQGDPGKPRHLHPTDQVASRPYESTPLSWRRALHMGNLGHLVGRHGTQVRSVQHLSCACGLIRR